MHYIDKMISELDIEKLKASIPPGLYEPYDYQWLVYAKCAEVIKSFGRNPEPSYVTASVSSGKTVMISMLCSRFQCMGWPGLVIARQSEIIDQDATELWNFGVKNSLYSASLGRKSTAYPIICGTEGTIVNALFDKKDKHGNITKKSDLSDFTPRFCFPDEGHQISWQDIISENSETQYGIILNELNRRCKEKYGHDLIVISFTGSPFRGTESMKGAYWKKEIINIDTKYMVDRGFVVPTIFGLQDIEDIGYDLSEFHGSEIDGVQDFNDSQMKAMEDSILKQKEKLKKIMQKVVELTADRNGVLITCAGKRHCKDVAKYLPEGTYAIITDDTTIKSRRKHLKDAYTGKIKYVLQVAALTTGVNIPLWDVSVILRKIMSLTLLVQLLGRGMRLLKKEHIEAGYVKHDHLVLDFSGTMFELGQLYEDPILEEAEAQRSKRTGEEVPCPKCGTMNSPFARRCIGKDQASPDGRCEEFFSFIRCGYDKHGIKIFDDGCGEKNDPTSRYCRSCDHVLRDPNAALNERAYTDNEWTDVKDFKIELTKDGEGILYRYLVTKADGNDGWANEVFYPFGDAKKHMKDMFKMKGVIPHIDDRSMITKITKCHNAKAFMLYTGLIKSPKRITHRFNDKGRDIIHRKDFLGEQIEAT